MQKSFHFGRRIGVPRQVGNTEITPESFVLLAQVGSWGYVWNWPLAVTIARPRVGPAAGSTAASPLVERHAIVDITRILLWSMRAITLLILLIAVFGPFFIRSRKRKPQ
jgi:hypothetical protein